MDIVDAQVHVWGADTPERPWNVTTGHTPHGPAEYTAEMALAQMDTAGVAAALLVPTSFEGDRNDMTLAATAAHPHRFRAHGRWNVISPETGSSIEADLAAAPGLRGLRLTFNGHAARWIEDGTIDWLWG